MCAFISPLPPTIMRSFQLWRSNSNRTQLLPYAHRPGSSSSSSSAKPNRRLRTCATDTARDAESSSATATASSPSSSSPAATAVAASTTTSSASASVDSLEHDGHVRATLGWIAVAAGSAAAIYLTRGVDRAVEFLTAYIVEYSLSVDNLFVFLLIFRYFQVPRSSQGKILTYGIIGAMVMRGSMIVAGEALTQRFAAVTVCFALLLLVSAGKLLMGEEDDEDDMSQNRIVKFSRSLLRVTDEFDGEKFFTTKSGMTFATPLMLVLLCVEFSDVVFALDSVPAVLGISNDTFVIYASNILAIQGLRNLYFVLSAAIGDLRFLRQSLAVVLGFVGTKMLAGVAGYEVGILQSLAVVVGTLGSGVGLSLAFPGTEEK